MSRFLASHWWWALIPLSFVACDSPTASEDDVSASGSYAVVQEDDAPVPGIEEVFERLGQEIPGFAGYYVDQDGVLVARLVDLKQAFRAREQLRATALAVTGTDQRAPTAEVRTEGADYDFSSLRRWRDRVRPLLGHAGVNALDADERANRVWIGVESREAMDEVKSEVEHLGVPLAAILVEVTEPDELLVAAPNPKALSGSGMPQAAETLRDEIRPLPGGMVMVYEDEPQQPCTIMANGTHALGSGFMVNSHCTNERGVLEGTDIYQPYEAFENVGYEVVDAGMFTGPPCPAGRRCGYADVAFIKYYSSNTGEFGAIAQPAINCTADCSNPTSREISATDPRWFIEFNSASAPVVGWGVQKVGQRTGWTSGLITNTCYDYNVPVDDETYLCQVRVNGITDFGDSGSPVFRFVAGAGPNKIALYGILHSGNPSTPAFNFSRWVDIESALGNIETHNPPNPPMSVSISGPSTGEAWSWVTVNAIVSDGASPFTYSWKINGSPACGNQSSCSGQLGASGTYTTFKVSVTDSSQPVESDSHSRNVFAEWGGGGGCPECPLVAIDSAASSSNR